MFKNISKVEAINNIYEKDFENKFIQGADDFYRPKIPRFEQNEVLEYLKKVNF